MNFSSQIAPRIAEERKRIGISQQEAGDKCGVSREMWGKYERGKATMGTEVLYRFADAGADVMYILTGQRSFTPPTNDPREAALLDHYRACDDRGKSAVDACSAALAEPREGYGVNRKKGAA